MRRKANGRGSTASIGLSPHFSISNLHRRLMIEYPATTVARAVEPRALPALYVCALVVSSSSTIGGVKLGRGNAIQATEKVQDSVPRSVKDRPDEVTREIY